jgi:predicted transposase/invertase (TIGR01784 family)
LLPKVVHISIVCFNLFDCQEFHSEHQILEITRHTPLTDKAAWHFFELLKLPELISPDDEMKLWLSLFNAKTEEDLAKIEQLGVPIMQQAIDAYRHISATDEFRELERIRSKARHDEAQAIYNAKKEEALSIAKNLLSTELSIDSIATATGLTRQEVEGLH